VKKGSSKIYLSFGLGILFFLVSLFGIKLLFKSYLSNIYYQTNEQVVGIFDRSNLGRALPASPIICYRAVFQNTALWSSRGGLETALANQDVLITVETWLKGIDYKNNVLKEVIAGRFDAQIKELAALVTKSRHRVFIRWNPDMEVPTDVYPWQFKSPEDYINSFHYFSKKIKIYAPGVQIIWGPSGYPGDTEYWPGNKTVDYVSITLGSKSELNTDFYPQDHSISDVLKHKLHRLRFIDKPILIMSGDNGKTQLKAGWLNAEKSYYNQYLNTIYGKNNYTDSANNKPVRNGLKIGVFDPNKRLINQQSISVEHLFTDWGEVERGDFEKKFWEVINRRHEVIVTMEPWRDTSGKSDTAVLKNILKGKYNQQIKKLFSIISSTKTMVYLRWMHEMEIPIHRYAWQSQDPVTYITAFRYFMQFDGGPGKNVKKVWGPAGDRGSVDFWPGSDVVDFISIAIYGLPDKNITDPEKQEAFSKIFNRKYFRMRFLDKPLFITEFGVKGPESFQNKWLTDAAKTINTNPHIFGICYFNLYDNPKAWGNIKAPDWSITANSMAKFSSLLKE
jgi:beta-mannanase